LALRQATVADKEEKRCSHGFPGTPSCGPGASAGRRLPPAIFRRWDMLGI
jgi:hypothetical protein